MSSLTHDMLKSPTAYTMRTSGFGANFDMFVAMVTLGRVELARELQDLQYLSEQLKKLQDLSTTAETFRDVVETWLSLFDLIPKISSQHRYCFTFHLSGHFLARIWGDAFQESKDPVFVWLVPVVVVATILTCCVISIVVYRCLMSGVRAGGYTVVSQGR